MPCGVHHLVEIKDTGSVIKMLARGIGTHFKFLACWGQY